MIIAFEHLVEKVEDEQRASRVEQVAMDEEGAPQVLEASEREVGSACRIASLFAEYADAHMCLLDHGDVVGAVAHRCSHRLLVALLHQSHHLRDTSTQIETHIHNITS